MVTFEATINGDPIYQGKPLIATFDLSVGNPTLSIPFDRALLLYGLPTAIIVPVAVAICHRYRKKRTKQFFQPRGCFYNSIFVPQTIL
jgi:hypothetical protein